MDNNYNNELNNNMVPNNGPINNLNQPINNTQNVYNTNPVNNQVFNQTGIEPNNQNINNIPPQENIPNVSVEPPMGDAPKKKNNKLLIIIIVLLLLVALGVTLYFVLGNKGKESSEDTSTNNVIDKQKLNENETITLEDVMNAKVVSEDEIFCIDAGEGECELNEYEGSETVIAIPETYKGMKITEMHIYLFGHYSSIVGIRLPDTMKKITKYVFGTNNNLQVVYAGKGIKEIGEAAFLNCPKLHTVILPEGLESIDEMAFSGNKNLKSIEIPSTVTKIAGSAFFSHADDFTIIGKSGSYAEQYANEQGITFKAK